MQPTESRWAPVANTRTPTQSPDAASIGTAAVAYETLQEWIRQGAVSEIHWFALGQTDHWGARLDGFPIHGHGVMPTHGCESMADANGLLRAHLHGRRVDEKLEPEALGHACDAMAKSIMGHGRFDVAYVHDPELVGLGERLKPAGLPSVLRWHAPFVPERIPQATLDQLLVSLRGCDGVVVNTLRDQQGLRRAGYGGHVRLVYPSLDAAAWPEPDFEDVERIEESLGIGSDEPLLVVAGPRVPASREDVVVKALRRIRVASPNARLVLATPAEDSGWKKTTLSAVREAGLEEAVRILDPNPADLRALIARSEAVILPSDVRGFGMSALYAWRYRRPVVASQGVGISELVTNGRNGYVFAPGDDEQLANALSRIIEAPDKAWAMGEEGARGLWRFEKKDRCRQLTETIDAVISDAPTGTS